MRLKAAFLSRAQNIEVEGRVHVRLSDQKLGLENFKFALDLAAFDPELISALLPELGTAGFTAGGRLSGELAPLVLEDGTPVDFQLRLRLAGSGRFDWPGKNPQEEMRGEFQAVLSDADLAQLVPQSAASSEPAPAGNLSADFKGALAGPDLSGTGRISVKNGEIRNLNVVREILAKLSLIPGLSDKLMSRLSEDYREKLKQNDTRFAPIDIPFRLGGGVLAADKINVSSENFQIYGAAQAVLSGPLSGRFFAAIDPEFSLALISRLLPTIHSLSLKFPL